MADDYEVKAELILRRRAARKANPAYAANPASVPLAEANLAAKSAVQSDKNIARAAIPEVAELLAGIGADKRKSSSVGADIAEISRQAIPLASAIFPPATEAGSVMDVRHAFDRATSEEAKLDVLKRYDPAMTVRRDEDGNAVVSIGGKEAYLNRPGLSGADVQQGVKDLAFGAPLSAAATVVGGPVGLAGKIGLQALAGLAGPVVRDIYASVRNKNHDLNPADYLASPIFAGLFEAAGAPAVNAIKRYINKKEYFNPKTGVFSKAAENAMRKEGIDPAALDFQVKKAFVQKAAESDPEIAARALRYTQEGISPTTAQLTRKAEDWSFEESALKGGKGSGAKKAVQGAYDAQREQLAARGQVLAGEAGGGGASRNLSEGMEGLQEALISKEGASRKKVDSAYGAIPFGKQDRGPSPVDYSGKINSKSLEGRMLEAANNSLAEQIDSGGTRAFTAFDLDEELEGAGVLRREGRDYFGESVDEDLLKKLVNDLGIENDQVTIPLSDISNAVKSKYWPKWLSADDLEINITAGEKDSYGVYDDLVGTIEVKDRSGLEAKAKKFAIQDKKLKSINELDNSQFHNAKSAAFERVLDELGIDYHKPKGNVAGLSDYYYIKTSDDDLMKIRFADHNKTSRLHEKPDVNVTPDGSSFGEAIGFIAKNSGRIATKDGKKLSDLMGGAAIKSEALPMLEQETESYLEGIGIRSLGKTGERLYPSLYGAVNAVRDLVASPARRAVPTHEADNVYNQFASRFKKPAAETPLIEIEQARRGINLAISAAKTDADKAKAVAIKKRFDAFIDDSIEKSLFTGNPEAIEKLKGARKVAADYFSKYEGEGKAERFISRIINDESVKANEIANFLYGQNKIGHSGASISLLRSLGNILGKDSREYGTIRAGLVQKAVFDPAGDILTPTKIYNNVKQLTKGQGKKFADALLSPNEILALTRFAETAKSLEIPREYLNNSGTAAALMREMGRRNGILTGTFGRIIPYLGAAMKDVGEFRTVMKAKAAARGYVPKKSTGAMGGAFGPALLQPAAGEAWDKYTGE